MSPRPRFDLITVGRIGIDLYPEQIGVPLAAVTTFARSLGGSATNVAVAAARLGAEAAVVTKVGADPFGEYARGRLAELGVDPRWVGTHPWLRTPLAFCEIHPPDEFPLLFYREPTAPDLTLGPEDFELGAIGAAGTFWVTGTGLSAEPCRAATLAALEHRAGGPGRAATILDLDYRPMFWRDRGGGAAAAKAARQALPWTTVAVGNLDEVEVAVGSREPREAARRLRALGPELAVVKMGPAGVFASDGEQEVEIGALEVPVLNGLGAGDAFGGALAVGLGRGLGLHRALELANAAGALVASRHACADAMPDEAELEAALA